MLEMLVTELFPSPRGVGADLTVIDDARSYRRSGFRPLAGLGQISPLQSERQCRLSFRPLAGLGQISQSEIVKPAVGIRFRPLAGLGQISRD